jgi:hypothetical protein
MADTQSMPARFGYFASIAFAIAAAALWISASPTFAQGITVPMPDEYLGSGASAAPEQIPDPTVILQDDGSSFSIPIPGGGEIQVEGPASEAPASIAPTENWATQRNTPFSIGGGPISPVPRQR